MGMYAPEQLAHEWAEVLAGFAETVRQTVQQLTATHSEALASYFYEEMLGDTIASQFLSHEQVKQRLHPSMANWIRRLFSYGPNDDIHELVNIQGHVGDVHARIGLPIHVVLRGARTLKHRCYAFLQADERLPHADKLEASRLVTANIDFSMEAMSNAYALSHDRNSRAEESYRLFSISQNIAAEKEKQRGALLDWENGLMYSLAIGLEPTAWPRIASTEFALWFRHKGAHAFEGSPEAERVLQALVDIDAGLEAMAKLSSDANEQRVATLRKVHENTRAIEYLMERLFDQQTELDAGRDELTRLLNRRFLSVVFNREIAYSRRSGTQFAVLAIDIDHFKAVNDTYGHEGGDQILQQMAALLSNNVRSGDYLFRLGGEEFLVLLVDASLASAKRVAQNLRRAVMAEPFRLANETQLEITISIGIAQYDGHPDYMRVLRQADDALYEAKRSGRNRVVAAPMTDVADKQLADSN